ncbi:MAG: efflux RND transporter permease subunit, partial [Campylobacterota bacterium]
MARSSGFDVIEKVIDFALRRPILNHMLLLFLAVTAVFAYINIPKEIFPPSKMDSVTVTGHYSGASSTLLDTMAVGKIEEDVINLSQTAKVTSVVKNGSFIITAELKDGYEANEVTDDIKDIVTATKPDLPTDMDEPVVKAVELSFPLINISLFDESKTKEQMLEIAAKMKTRLMGFEDLSEVIIRGDSDLQIEITLDEQKLQAYGIDPGVLVNALSSISSIYPAGLIEEQKRHYYLSTANGTTDAGQLAATRIKVGGKVLTLGDVADVQSVLSTPDTISRFNGKENITVSISKGEEGDSIELVKAIKGELEEFLQAYPGVEYGTFADTSIWVKNRLNNVVSNIAFGLILLFAALFYFINYRIASVVAIGIPTSFAIGLIGAYYVGFSLNMLTLLGALIALGMLVDEAIVVAENIYRHMEEGKSRHEAAIVGAKEMFPAVLTATATTIFAFLPILTMTGSVGKFMQVLPVMIVILLLSSLLEAFFFLPLHAKQLLKKNIKERSGGIWEFNKRLYRRVLEAVLHRRLLSLAVIVSVILALTAVLAKTMKFEFMAPFDTTQIYITGSVGPGQTLAQCEEGVKTVEEAIMQQIPFDKEMASISSIAGLKLDGQNKPMMEPFYFQVFVNLHERAPSNFVERYITPYLSPKYDDSDMIRQDSAFVMKSRVDKALKGLQQSGRFDELKVFVPQTGIVKNDIEIAFSGQQEAVKEAIERTRAKLEGIKGVSDVDDDLMQANFELKLRPNSYGQSLGIDEGYLLQ